MEQMRKFEVRITIEAISKSVVKQFCEKVKELVEREYTDILADFGFSEFPQ